MDFKTVDPGEQTDLFVKSIMVFEEADNNFITALPFFADGYPGLMFQETENGLVVKPHNKMMPNLFLYGQTIKPIELNIHGTYRLIVFQLYPFVLKKFFGVTAKDINDDCFNLSETEVGIETTKQLLATTLTDNRINIISSYLLDVFSARKNSLDYSIKQSILLILEHKAQISIKQICERICLTERTFQRRFLNEAGMTAKQFSQIIKFQQSLEQLSAKDFTQLSEIVYSNGYADQSHFIRVFKAFTGKTPRSFIGK